MKYIFLYFILSLGSDSFFIRENADKWLRFLVDVTDSPIYLLHGVKSDDLEIRTRCKRIFERYTLDLRFEMESLNISEIKKEYLIYWNNDLEILWNTGIKNWTLQDYNQQSDLNHERGQLFIKWYVENGAGRKALRKLWKSCRPKNS